MLAEVKGKNRVRTTVWVLILDENGAPVGGATVQGAWSGATTGGDTVVTTNGEGVARFRSSWVKTGGTFTFTVNDVAKSEYLYESEANVETSDSVTLIR